ncbi:MAG TPA: hypothetical protein IAB44_15710 [Candidatus Limivivens intestinipullorum]|uniref:Uncharacterized protein n=1 Tax=Candidatus Limivivens intestinipullorum TaxID=2840858 RepID=A0A9D1JLB8_9FIRM|nr:hypothetical protein [Candidatus Limivivens intestinipullorum]
MSEAPFKAFETVLFEIPILSAISCIVAIEKPLSRKNNGQAVKSVAKNIETARHKRNARERSNQLTGHIIKDMKEKSNRHKENGKKNREVS